MIKLILVGFLIVLGCINLFTGIVGTGIIWKIVGVLFLLAAIYILFFTGGGKGAKMKNGKLLILAVISVLSLSVIGSVVLANVDANGKYFDPNKQDTVQFNLKLSQKVVLGGASGIPSSLKITNPYAAPGQVVAVDVSITNEGGQFPFNVIDLPPNQFGLMVAVDKENDYVVCGNPTSTTSVKYNLWATFTPEEKLAWSTAELQNKLVNSLKPWVDVSGGSVCQFRDASNDKIGETTVKQILKDNVCGGLDPGRIVIWDCMKIMDEATFKNTVNLFCPKDLVDSSCAQKLNDQINVQVQNLNDVMTCYLSNDAMNSVSMKNGILTCGIGNGLSPGETATFRFYILVPSDTPVASAAEASLIDNAVTVQGTGDVSLTESCDSLGNPQGCHSLYMAVFPVSKTWTTNFVGWLTNIIRGSPLLKGIAGIQNCGIGNWIFNRDAYNACAATTLLPAQYQVIGDPIKEEQGVFFCFGPSLGFSASMMLLAALAAGSVGGIFGRRG